MKKIMFAFTGIMLGLSAMAQSLTTITLPNQWGKSVEINKNTQLVVFSADKASGNLVKEVFGDLALTDLSKRNWTYVADISGMPSLITKMFALPKMKKYPFAMGLDREGKVTQALPRETDKVSVIQLQQLKVVDAQFFDNKKALKDYLQLLLN